MCLSPFIIDSILCFVNSICLKLSPRHQDTQYCADKRPYPRAGCNDSTAPTAFPKISNQPPYSCSYQRTENVSGHNRFYLVSRHSINASPDARKKPGALIQTGRIIPSRMTSHPKKSRRRCSSPTNEKMITAMVVNGFMACSLLTIVCVSHNSCRCGIQIRFPLEIIITVRVLAS